MPSSNEINPERVFLARVRTGKTHAQLAVEVGVTEEAVRNWEAKRNGKPAKIRIRNLRALSDALRVEPDELIKNASREIRLSDNGDTVFPELVGQPWDADAMDLAGIWNMEGGDIVVPGHFEYLPNSPSCTLTIRQHGLRILAEGTDHDGDSVSAAGKLTEGGNFIFAEYRIRNPRMHHYGVLALKYLGDQKTMRGFYLGRDTGHGTGLILGWLRLTRIG